MIFDLNEGDEGGSEMFRELFGPGHIDATIRQAVQMCWMALPPERKTVDELETQIRRVVERALRDFREDRGAFSE